MALKFLSFLSCCELKISDEFPEQIKQSLVKLDNIRGNLKEEPNALLVEHGKKFHPYLQLNLKMANEKMLPSLSGHNC